MRKILGIFVVLATTVVFLAAAACGGDTSAVEEDVGAVQQEVGVVQEDVAALRGDVQSLQGSVAEAEGAIGTVSETVAATEGKIGTLAIPARQVEFIVTGVELKGGTSRQDLVPPSVDPTTLSDGYRYKPPGEASEDDPDRWEVASYIWSPAAMTVFQGDEVTLRTFIINGDEHTTWVEDPDGEELVTTVEMNRGREYVVTFTADKAGTYRLICDEHEPTMRATITALPRA